MQPSRRGVAQPGSALAWGARGREFESRHPDQSFCSSIKPAQAGFIVLPHSVLLSIIPLLFSRSHVNSVNNCGVSKLNLESFAFIP